MHLECIFIGIIEFQVLSSLAVDFLPVGSVPAFVSVSCNVFSSNGLKDVDAGAGAGEISL